MVRDLVVSRSILATMLNNAYPAPDDAGPYGPYGPVIRRFVENMLNPQPLPPKGGPQPDPWFGAAAAAATIRYALEQQELLRTAGQEGEPVRHAVARFVDDFCGTPSRPRWPFPWPPPKWWTAVEEIGPVDILVAAAQFHRIAESLPDNALAAEFDAGADKMFDVGLKQLSG